MIEKSFEISKKLKLTFNNKNQTSYKISTEKFACSCFYLKYEILFR